MTKQKIACEIAFTVSKALMYVLAFLGIGDIIRLFT